MVSVEIPIEHLERAALRLSQEYIEVVDNRDLDKWVDLFADEASYMVTSAHNIATRGGKGLPVGFAHDHNKNRIHDRVTLIREAWEGHYDDYRTRHVASMSLVDIHPDGSAASLLTNLAIYITEPNVVGSRLLAVGQYRDEIVFTDDGPKFRSKFVVLDTSTLPRYFTWPL